jgi:CheY-like chemotaxis protein
MSARSPRILVVDDDANARLIMRAALSKAGYEIVLADGGVEALHVFRTEPCDLVMLDVDMPASADTRSALCCAARLG